MGKFTLITTHSDSLKLSACKSTVLAVTLYQTTSTGFENVEILNQPADPKWTSGMIICKIFFANPKGLIWWPAMVDFDEKGVYADYDPVTHKATHYWVVSLDPQVMTAKRLPALCLRKYVHGALIDESLRKSKHWSRLKKAIEAAEDALTLPVHMRIERYGYSFSKKKKNISTNRSHNKQRKYEACRSSTRIKHQKRNNTEKVPHRHQGERISGVGAILGDVDIPLVKQAIPTRTRRPPSAYQVSGEFSTQEAPSNSSGGSKNQKSSQATAFNESANCPSECTLAVSSRKTKSEGLNNRFTHTFGSPNMIFYKRFFATEFLEDYIQSREEEGNCGISGSNVEESIKPGTLCNGTIVHPLSTLMIALDSGHERSTSIVNFLKAAIHSQLEGRSSMIRKLSAKITNLPFHLQLKPTQCHACPFK
eukprot:TsM_000295900 transcript=TsM_000295900 gene=TsM_000295900